MNGCDHILHVNLETEKCIFHPVTEKHLSHALGGRGFNVSYLFDHLPANIDPLSPENILMISCGMLTGF